MSENKNSIFFVTTLDSGGLENYLLRFLQYKASEFDNIILFCKGGKGGQLEKQFLALPNITIHKKKIGYYNPKHYFYIYKFIKKNNSNIVCDFTGNFAGLILLQAKKAGVEKRIAFYRGSSNHFQESTLRLLYNKFVKKLTFNNATNILSNSKAAFNFFFPEIWKNDIRFEVVYNGINPKLFLEENKNLRNEFNIPEEAFVVGHIGRYNAAKNHTTIIQVAIELCRKYEDIYFLLCGNEVKDNLSSIITKEKLDNRIFVQNNRTDIPKVLNTLNCFYFPSFTEGQPNALIEAMVAGLPIIASNIGPIKETVPPLYHKELIPPLSVKLAVNKISEVYLKKHTVILKEWALNNFNYKIHFDSFYRILQNSK